MIPSLTSSELAHLPPPQVIESLKFEQILDEMLTDLQKRAPQFTALIESDPAAKILEVAAYRELLLRQRINEAARALMLAYAQGSDLDHLAANVSLTRRVVTPASMSPPTPPVYESDEELRTRILLSFESYSTAGSRGSYLFHALNASGDCKDVAVNSLTPGVVTVAVLSRTGTGVALEATLALVRQALNDEKIRPLCDRIEVVSAQIVPYRLEARLRLTPGMSQADVRTRVMQSLEQTMQQHHQLGRLLPRSALFAALHQPGVAQVILSHPQQDLVLAWNQALYASSCKIGIE